MRFDLGNVLLTTGLASAATQAAIAILGKVETGHVFATTNAVSHILWGDRAAKQNGADVKHTLAGAAINASAMMSWAVTQELLFGARVRGKLGPSLAAGAATSAIAYVTDYHVVPKRFTPGFEKRLSGGALATVYGVLALALGTGLYLGTKKRD